MREYEKRKAENERRNFAPASDFRNFAKKNCPACGAPVSRDFANYCRVCRKSLKEDYQPLDTLRASYRLQGKRIEFKPAPAEKVENLFEKNENPASTTAWAFAVYSLVPYIGIIFCPGAIIAGSYGLFVARRKPYLGGRRVSFRSIIVGFIVLAVQIFLWWLLYIVPTLGRHI